MLGRNRNNNVIAPTAQPTGQNNVISANHNNLPPARSNVIRPITSTATPKDKVRLVPVSGGIGTTMTRQRAQKAANASKGALIIKEI